MTAEPAGVDGQTAGHAPGTAEPTWQVALREMQSTAARHEEAGERHESSCADVLRTALRTVQSLPQEELDLLIRQATADGLLSAGSQARHVMTHLVRLAAGRHEHKSTISRLATLGRHLLEKGRPLEDVLPSGVRVWALEKEYRTDRVRVRVVNRTQRLSARDLLLDPEDYAALLAGRCDLRVYLRGDRQTLGYDVTPAHNTAIEEAATAACPVPPDDPPTTDAPASAPADADSPEAEAAPAPTPAEAVPSELVLQEKGEEPGAIVEPAGRRPGQPAALARMEQGKALADPLPPAIHMESERREVTVAFGKHVRTNDSAGFDELRMYGNFRPRSDTGRRGCWTGHWFPRLDEIIRRNEGEIVDAGGGPYATAA